MSDSLNPDHASPADALMSEGLYDSDGCLSDLSLDRHLAGELRIEVSTLAGAHLSKCAGCRRRLAELERDREAFLAEMPDFNTLVGAARTASEPVATAARLAVVGAEHADGKPHRAKAQRGAASKTADNKPVFTSRVWTVAATLAAVVALAVLSRSQEPEVGLGRTPAEDAPGVGKLLAEAPSESVPSERPETASLEQEARGASGLVGAAAPTLKPSPQVRTKGGGLGSSQLGFFVSRKGEVRRGDADTRLRAGDTIAFSYSIDQPLHLTVFTLGPLGPDGALVAAGQPLGFQVLVDGEKTTSQLTVGRDVPLDPAFELDGEPRDELYYGAFCLRPPNISLLRRWASAEPLGDGVEVEGCHLARLVLRKEVAR